MAPYFQPEFFGDAGFLDTIRDLNYYADMEKTPSFGKTYVDAVNEMFLIFVAVLAMIVAFIVLCLSGHGTLAVVLSPLVSILIFGSAFAGIVFCPRQTHKVVSSDWLVNILVKRRMRKQSQVHK